MERIIINPETAEVEVGFQNQEQIDNFLADYKIKKEDVVILPAKEVKKNPELTLYPNGDNRSCYSFVAEFAEDLLMDDLTDNPDEPVKYTIW